MRYRLAGKAIDAVVAVERIDGHWYLAISPRRRPRCRRAGAGGNTAAPPNAGAVQKPPAVPPGQRRRATWLDTAPDACRPT